MRKRTNMLACLFIALAHRADAQSARFDVLSVTAEWINPVGGTANSGMGTDVFQTGNPIAPSSPTSLSVGLLVPPPRNVFVGVPFIIGGVSVTNGTTATGSTASAVSLKIDVTAQTDDFVPSLTILSIDIPQIFILNTPNTDDPIASRDLYWSPRFGEALAVDEGGAAVTTLYGKLVPNVQAIVAPGSPLAAQAAEISDEYRLEVIGFGGPTTGGGQLVPNPSVPEPSSAVLAGLGMLGLCRKRSSAKRT